MENEFVFGHGKICYIEIPSSNIARSAAFFETVFNWKIRARDDGSVSFDDGVNGVSGVWLLGRKPSTSGIMISIMVDDAAATLEQITANGGKVVTPIGRHLPEITASFTDPTGNLWSIYQHRG
jgi:predicted enzyme related to lactoylglutathione lyase